MDIIMKCKKIKKDTIVYSTRVAPLARVFRASLAEDENHLHGD